MWGVNLDAISMITIIMSIGFSVDFSAHITYGYVISAEDEPTDRVRMALGALGWPIAQGALSTILGVCVLSSVNAYMIVTFFKTVFLVIVIGALHGLVFLPVMLSLFVRGFCVIGQKAARQRRESIVMPPSPGDLRSTSISRKPSLPQTADEEVAPADDVQPFGRYGIYLPRMSSHDEDGLPISTGPFHWPHIRRQSHSQETRSPEPHIYSIPERI